ncbi:MAG: Lrp/AsnC family transcriptional regulator [Thermovirga sp.]|nr:Lrp/AsnC family transcriptional regulator [Thermovirga sp.]
MKKNKTLKFVSLLFASVLVLTILSPTFATATTTAPKEKSYLGYSKFDTGGMGYKEFGDLRAAIYGAIKEAGAKAYPLDYIASKTGLSKSKVADRINRMANEKYFTPIMSINVNTTKFFPYYVYYVAVKLKPGISATEKEALTKKIRDNVMFCTSYELDGDFDYWIGWHIDSWESWSKKIQPALEDDAIESYILLPTSAQIRHGMINAYAVPEDMVCDVSYPSNFNDLPTVTNGKVTSEDVEIIRAWNKRLPLEQQFNWDKVAKISGKSKDDLLSTLKGLRDSKILFGPYWGFNWKALGVNRRFFFVQLKNALPDSRRVELISDFARANNFSLAYYQNDSLIKFTLIAPEGLADINQCRNKIKTICGDDLVHIYEAKEVQQLRWWGLLWYQGEKWGTAGGLYHYEGK